MGWGSQNSIWCVHYTSVTAITIITTYNDTNNANAVGQCCCFCNPQKTLLSSQLPPVVQAPPAQPLCCYHHCCTLTTNTASTMSNTITTIIIFSLSLSHQQPLPPIHCYSHYHHCSNAGMANINASYNVAMLVCFAGSDENDIIDWNLLKQN